MALLKYESQVRPPLIDGNKNYHQVTEDIVRPIETDPSKLWWIGFLIAVALLCFGIYSIYREVVYGIGQWNINHTIGWGWDITNFVWWIGIGHAGNIDICNLIIIQARMENWCEPRRRSDDDFCSYLRGAIFRSGTWAEFG